MADRIWDDEGGFADELDDDLDGELDDESGEERDEESLDDDLDDDSLLDDEFPMGDGVADLSGLVSCPYCGE